jgi:hypothetical protein
MSKIVGLVVVDVADSHEHEVAASVDDFAWPRPRDFVLAWIDVPIDFFAAVPTAIREIAN